MRHGSGGLGHRRGAMRLYSGGVDDVCRGSSKDQTVVLEQGMAARERTRRLRWWRGTERSSNAVQEQGVGMRAARAWRRGMRWRGARNG